MPAALFAVAALALGAGAQQDTPQLGFKDTPMLPGAKWHVHDGERPQPTVVTPGEPTTVEKVTTTTTIITT